MTGRERRPVTIYEVADRAGVSIATVSRALRGSDLVAAATRLRVRQVAEELRFRPSGAGRALAEGQHAANGIVFPDLSGPYYAEVVLGYEEVVAELGRSVLILATNGRANAAETALELAGRVDGMVIMGRTVGDDVVARIADTGVPLVLLARQQVGPIDTVTADNADSARALTEHLLAHGHRDIAFSATLPSPPTWPVATPVSAPPSATPRHRRRRARSTSTPGTRPRPRCCVRAGRTPSSAPTTRSRSARCGRRRTAAARTSR
jgi:LacI family transcriptional regulator